MLLSGCCAVSVEPPVCVWKRSIMERSLFGMEALLHDFGPQPAGRPVFRDLFQQIVVCIEEEGEPAGKFVDVHPGLQRGLHIGDAVGQGKGDLLRRCGAGLPDVVAGDGNGVPLRHVLGAEFKRCS